MSAKRTPGPYKAERGGSRGAWIGNKEGDWLCLTCGDTDDVARANTEFILRACNNFEAMLVELKEIAEFADTEGALREQEIASIRRVIKNAEKSS